MWDPKPDYIRASSLLLQGYKGYTASSASDATVTGTLTVPRTTVRSCMLKGCTGIAVGAGGAAVAYLGNKKPAASGNVVDVSPDTSRDTEAARL